MEIKGEQLLIQASSYDPETGHKLEPEEKLAKRVLHVDAPAVGNLDGSRLGNFKASVSVTKTVNEFASDVRSICALCKHFDERGWQTLKRKLEGSKDGVMTLNAIRARILETGNARLQEMHEGMDGDVDLEHALNSMGICRALSEVFAAQNPGAGPLDNIVSVHPAGCCPTEVVDEKHPEGLFENKDTEAERAGANLYDQMLHRAMGVLDE